MSVYGTVVCEMNDLDRLQEAIRLAGLGDRMKVYEATGVYRKWSYSTSDNQSGRVRGRDASIVIHGGIDNQGDYCGDTAFVVQPDGTVTAEIDIAHNNAAVNWNLIRGHYAMIGAERQAKAMGCTVKVTIDPATGNMTGQFVQERPAATRGTARQAAARPVARRTDVRR